MEVAPHVRFMHCMIYRFRFSRKALPAKLFSVISLVIKLVNREKVRTLHNQLFKLLGEDFGANYRVLLLHTNVRWLSRGNVTKRVYELCWNFSTMQQVWKF